MSALDDIITIYNVTSATPLNGEDMQRVIDARAELAALRDRAAEYDRIAELIDPNGAQGYIGVYEQIVNLLHDDSTAAIVAEQARRIDEAREIFENIFKRDWSNNKIHDRARAWLSATAAAPQDAQP